MGSNIRCCATDPRAEYWRIMNVKRSPTGGLRAIPLGVWVLGFVSMLMDISSEMIHALLPVYLVTGLGATAATVGFIEGFAVATAMVTRLFSGVLSDWFGNRKLLAGIGYGLAALSKPIFPIAETVSWIVGARFLDRVGKGIRSAPRDALIADITPPAMRGASFGLRKSLDTVGGFVGPLAAIGLMLLTGDHFTTVFWIAVVPSFLAIGLLVVGVKEPEHAAAGKTNVGIRWKDAALLNGAAWSVIIVSVILTMARLSEAFLILRSQQAGLSVAWIPLVMVVMHIVYGLAAYPVGALSDRLGRIGMLVAGLVFLIGAYGVLAYADTIMPLMVGVVLWGLHMGFTQGILATLIADTAPANLRATAFGIFNLLTGGVVLIGNVLAGVLWDAYGPVATFLTGAGLSIVAILGLALLRVRPVRGQ
jgi:MFS family permease